MCFSLFAGVARLFGCTKRQIFKAKRWWYKRKVSLLPMSYYRSGYDFVSWHAEGVRTGDAILQRMQALSQENGDEIYRYNLHPDYQLNDHDQSIYSADEIRLQDLGRLRVEWGKLNAKLCMGTLQPPFDAVKWLYLHFWRQPAYDDGRTYAWEHDRHACAERDGCCARTCGCCKKVLREYWAHEYMNPDETIGENRKCLKRVYAHCTSECACCVITHEVYEPDRRLPRPGFVAEGNNM